MNAKQCATLCEVFKNPSSQNISYLQVITLLTVLGAQTKLTKSGVIVKFVGGIVWSTHRPHPQPQMDKAAVNLLQKALFAVDLIPTKLGCICKN
jgi:hypothetical protein